MIPSGVSSEVAISEEPVPASAGARRIAHYEIQTRIGVGGMGVVYRALDTKLRRSVALKVLHPNVAEDEDRRKRFVREGRLVAHLTHPNIATVYDVGEADGRVYIAMELVEGEPLTAMIEPGRRVEVCEALRIVHEVTRGLAKAHEIGVIHRDLKPDNIMVGDDGIVKILDFGVAKRLDNFKVDFTDIKTQHGSLVGTPAYMSPEQAAGKKEVDQRSDIFSVGVVLFELLTGKRPFEGETWQETIIAINRDEPPLISTLRSDVPAAIDEMVDRCLAKQPESRYETCRELLEDIESILMASSTGTFPPGASGILARAGASSTPPPQSGEVGSDPTGRADRPDLLTMHERTAEPVARSMDGDGLERPQRRGMIYGGLVVAAVAIGLIAYAAMGETASEAEAPVVGASAAEMVDGPAGDEPSEQGAAPELEADADAAPSASTEPTAEPSTPGPPVSVEPRPPRVVRPSPVAPGPKPVPPPRSTTKPKNPVLGF
ncbi:MAG TPA: serine/threonine protein kinase [Polyangiaceae bacterium]|nr:serine/threonine protein kinase [Polyangiaceae bacterium]